MSDVHRILWTSDIHGFTILKMRKEPFGVGDYVHVIKRGARGMHLGRDEADRWRFLLMLLHFNDHFNIPENWFRDLMVLKIANTFERPSIWPKKNPLVKILAFCLMDNHFHLLIKEIVDNGISAFMKKLGIGMSKHFNEKYKENGSLFQGAYKAKRIGTDNYLKCTAAYIQVKNSFELYPKGYEMARSEFEKAYEWASNYTYCSLGDYAGKRESPIIEKELLGKIFETPGEFKSFSRNYILNRNKIGDFVSFDERFE